MGGWAEFGLALAVFVGSHFLPRLGGLRDRLIGRFGRRPYFLVYGVVSVILLGWLIGAAGRTPYVELWPQMPWMRWVPNVALPVAILLVTCGVGLPNPFTLGSRRNAVFDREKPGFAAVSRHPLFVALALWAGSHLVVNGDLAHVILFGIFLAMAVVAIPVFDGKARRELGPDAGRFLDRTAVLSFAPLCQRTWLKANGPALLRRGFVGLIVWVGVLEFHVAVIGISALPL
ncbi:NnrU family protein [Amaricoccus tamworthensis]|uniref:NnrU family protein n=1 Tax=Amaricoccus tamworthensis TaxID=57002 RepID=UPI003C7BE771